ncbi:MAG: hypothetical protein ACK4SY_06735 [Pyrobaculum sp.]
MIPQFEPWLSAAMVIALLFTPVKNWLYSGIIAIAMTYILNMQGWVAAVGALQAFVGFIRLVKSRHGD